MQRQFFHDVVDVALHGVHGNAQAHSNVFVAQTVGDGGKDFPFTFGYAHCSGYLTLAASCGLLDDVSKERSCQRGRKNFRTLGDIPDRLHKFSHRSVFEDESRSPCLDKLNDIGLCRNEAHPDDPRLGVVLAEQFHHGQVSEILQAHVEQYHIRLRRADARHDVVTAADCRCDPHASLRIDHGFEAIPQEAIVVNDKYSDRFHGAMKKPPVARFRTL